MTDRDRLGKEKAQMSSKTIRGLKYIEYAQAIEQGAIVTRQECAEHFGVSYSTARFHLDRAVEAGLLHKQYGFISEQPGWLYALPETMPRLGGM